MRFVMLSTHDNPFNPFENFSSWYFNDKFNCSGKLARIFEYSKELSMEENERLKEKAIDRLIALDFTDTFIKVVNESNDDDEVDE